MIVKVQISLASSGRYRRMLVYSKKRGKGGIMFEANLDRAVSKLMGKKVKAYFNSHMDGTILVFDDEVPEQDW